MQEFGSFTTLVQVCKISTANLFQHWRFLPQGCGEWAKSHKILHFNCSDAQAPANEKATACMKLTVVELSGGICSSTECKMESLVRYLKLTSADCKFGFIISMLITGVAIPSAPLHGKTRRNWCAYVAAYSSGGCVVAANVGFKVLVLQIFCA